MKSWKVAQKLHSVKKISLCQGSCLVVFLSKISRKLLAPHETNSETEAESTKTMLKLKSC